MNLNLKLIEESPDMMESGDIDDFNNIIQNAYIWHNDGLRW